MTKLLKCCNECDEIVDLNDSVCQECGGTRFHIGLKHVQNSQEQPEPDPPSSADIEADQVWASQPTEYDPA